MAVVKEAEKTHDSLHTLSEIYGVAVDVYSKAPDAEDYDLSDLSVKRMRVLCRLNPAEAREFHNRLRAYSTGRADARMYEARAEMENRLGDAAKAIKMLQEGLRVGAQPEEALRRQLKKLQPESSTSSSTRDGNSNAAGQEEKAESNAAPPPTKPAMTVVVTPPSAVSGTLASASSATKPAESSTIPSSGGALAVTPTRTRPRLLGLGPAERVLPGEQNESNDAEEETTVDEAEAEEEDEDGKEDEEEDVQVKSAYGNRLSTTMGSQHATSTMPLSPIQEGESHEEATSESAPRTGDRRDSIPPPGSTAPTPTPTPRREREVVTPRSSQRDISLDSGTPSVVTEGRRHATPSRESKKCIHVNGVAYTQIHTIGRGGSSKVYLVQTPTGESVALKRVTTDNAKQLEAFQNEVDLLRRLRGQDRVIQVLDAEVDLERCRIHIVMEAADMDLTRFLQSEQRLSLAKVQNIWKQMLEAVQVIHNARIVHSDLKPANFVLVGGQLKVIDFGIAKRISNDTTNISRDASVGTLSYMAPEAVKNGSLKLGRSSDIWSLGIILYQMVYQSPPFAHLEPMQRVLLLNSPDLQIEFPEGHCLEAHSSTTKAQLLDILEGCLQRDARRRPSLADLLAHPFLRSSAEVQREALGGTISSMMGQVMKALGDTVQVPESESAAAAESWQVLADEVYEHVSGSHDAASSEASEFAGLAPLSVFSSRVAEIQQQRDSAVAELRRQETRNAELEEQVRKLLQRLPAEKQARSSEKENVSAVRSTGNTASRKIEEGKQYADGNSGAERPRSSRLR
jgi:hypothetical protein